MSTLLRRGLLYGSALYLFGDEFLVEEFLFGGIFFWGGISSAGNLFGEISEEGISFWGELFSRGFLLKEFHLGGISFAVNFFCL